MAKTHQATNHESPAFQSSAHVKVHTIAPSQPRRALRVAAYCRVSTDSDEQETSYEAQCRHYKAFISENPAWELVGIYADEGITGTSTKRREQFKRMIADCEAGRIDLVVTKSISRFARNTLDCLQYIRHLKALGIAVDFEKEAINTLDAKGEVLISIMASLAQQESQSISQNVRLGIQYRMREGKGRLNTAFFMGYEKDPLTGALVIVPEQAAVVRRVFREYLEGFSPAAIGRRLQADGIPTPKGGSVWYQSTVSSMLENEKYCGDLLLQKYYTVDFLSRKIVRNTGELPQYYVEDDHEPIVPKSVFALVQSERARRSSRRDVRALPTVGDGASRAQQCDPVQVGLAMQADAWGQGEQGRQNNCAPLTGADVQTQAPQCDLECGLTQSVAPRIDRGMQRALAGRLKCGICGRTLKRYTKPDDSLSDWRCRSRAYAKKTNHRECEATCKCRPVPETEVKRAIVEAFNKLPAHRDELIRLQEALRGEPPAELQGEPPAEPQGGPPAVSQSGLPGNTSGGVPAELQDGQMGNGFASRHPGSSLRSDQRVCGPWCNMSNALDRIRLELDVRFLLELVDQMTPQSKRSAREQANCLHIPTKSDAQLACYDQEQFFQMTQRPLPVGLLDANGRMQRFDDELVMRYVKDVLVTNDGCAVRFKAGVTEYYEMSIPKG